ncbi:hypothetical protein FB45DRAFT_942730 [Roridomyces roridus]|uniref:Uncharacterized protein n=1 Tax=Roridomyces roridus TaxID=1738132 RepID=A0AAD7FBI6_9AGAR|nr:hypothetical protein FB45DRAFT_942730 [Roridomyces roridus]
MGSLRRIEEIHNRPNPCTPGTDIVGLPLETLREMAIRAYKLVDNWDSNTPRVASFHSFDLDGGGRIWHIRPIYGEHLFITVSEDRPACWDATTGECLAVHDRDPEVPWVSEQSLEPFFHARKCYIGLASCSGPQVKLATICIDYENTSAIDISTIFSRTWECPDIRVLRCVPVVNNHRQDRCDYKPSRRRLARLL